MDEKDRIITAIYNDTRARARSVPALSCLLSLSCHPPPGASVLTTQVLSPARANRAKLQERLQSQQLQPRPGGPGIVPPGTGTDTNSGPGAAH